MSNQLFINKYQPTHFRDFVNENNETIQLLQTFLQINDLNLLLVGSPSSGKTTIINTLIQEYYDGILIGKCFEENVLHINNLKEQGIHYYRSEVRTFCQTRSGIPDKKKILVLDDLDNLNEQSQQVFRNYIDKFSSNVHFICSCTNVHKVIENLQSRLTILKLPMLTEEQIVRFVKNIQTSEEIELTEDAFEFVLTISNHSLKVLTNYMEKFKIFGECITLPIAKQLCTSIDLFSLEQYTQRVLNQDLLGAIQIMNTIYDKGFSVMDILDTYFLFIKSTTILSEEQKHRVIPFLCKYITVFTNIHEDEIELYLFTNNIMEELASSCSASSSEAIMPGSYAQTGI